MNIDKKPSVWKGGKSVENLYFREFRTPNMLRRVPLSPYTILWEHVSAYDDSMDGQKAPFTNKLIHKSPKSRG